MPAKPHFHLMVLSRSWSYDYWEDIHNEVPSHSIPDHGPSLLMEHRAAIFDARPSETEIERLLIEHDLKIGLYDGHLERAAFTIIDDQAWSVCKAAEPWCYFSDDDDYVFHKVEASEVLIKRYPNLTAQIIAAPAKPDSYQSAH